jgi:hypothetical protein
MGFDLTWCELPREVLEAQEYAMGGDAGEEGRERYRHACRTTGCTFRYDGFHAVRTLDTGSGGIPLQKLSTNDFWHVTSTEIESASSAASEYPRFHAHDLIDPHGNTLVAEPMSAALPVQLPRLPDGEESLQLWRRWLAFLSGASRHGGFIVS